MAETRSTCPYCGVGCGVIIETTPDAQAQPRITGVRGDPDHPANFGRLCSKGANLHHTASEAVRLHERLLEPRWRAHRGAAAEPIGWDAALATVTERIADAVRRKGPDSVGFYLSGQLLTEDYAVFNKLARGRVGTHNVDTNSRLCMSSAVSGYKQSLGADAPPACYDDIADAGCLFIAGSNAAWAHPVLYRRIEDARAARPALRTIVVDPRRTDTAAEADLHLALQPGSDVALFHAMLHVMVWEGWLDGAYVQRHTEGFAALKQQVAAWTPREAARITGLSPAQIETAARWFAWGGADAPPEDAAPRAATLSLYCQGLNQSRSGTAKNSALINLHLATGQIGRRGAGPFSLTGQPNAMGGREAGGLATALPGHRDPADPAHRAEVAAIWGVPALPERPGLPAVQMFEAAARGELEVLWIVCTNPAMSMPDQNRIREALARCPFVIVQEAFADTETAALADLLLPATTWGEKDGTVTNSERRISRVRAAVPPPGQARADWSIAAEVGRRLEPLLNAAAGEFAQATRDGAFDYPDAQAVWNEHRATTVGRDLDIGGLSWAMLDALGPQQWPLPAGALQGRKRLYEDGVFPTPTGRARFVAAPVQAVAEAPDARHPFSLTTGRLRDQWHGMSRSGTVPALFAHAPQPVLQMHPQDMVRRQLRSGDLAELRSRRGSLVLPVQADEGLKPLQLQAAMHWGGRFVGGQDAQGRSRGGVNTLTHAQACGQSHQPELKHAAVSVVRAELPWRLQAMAWLAPAAAVAARRRLVALFARFAHARCVPVQAPAMPAMTGLAFDAASVAAPDDLTTLMEEIEQALGLAEGPVLRYADAQRGERRVLRLGGAPQAARLDALVSCGARDGQASAWLAPLWRSGRPLGPAGRAARALLQPDDRDLRALREPETREDGRSAQASRQVCSCLGVHETPIRSALATLAGTSAERLQALQSQLGCGTSCGSCRPELRRLVAAVEPQADPARPTLAANTPATTPEIQA